ncbi:MAG: hypothetical protein ACREV9_12780 [Burkholderiales bacterium]
MIGVLQTVLHLIEQGATHVGVATDHVIESFRNRIWPGYKTSAGIEPALLAQFHPAEEALTAMGIAVWPGVTPSVAFQFEFRYRPNADAQSPLS